MSSDIFYKFHETKDLEKIKKAKIFFGVYSKKLSKLKFVFFKKWKNTNSNPKNYSSYKKMTNTIDFSNLQ